MHVSLIINKVMGELRERCEEKEKQERTNDNEIAEQSRTALEGSMFGEGWESMSGSTPVPKDSDSTYRLLSSRSLFHEEE